MNIKASVVDLIGNTPLLYADRFSKENGLDSGLIVKLEAMNPLSSVKDRAALNMIESAMKEGKLKIGGTMIEATSGNTGIGLAAVAAVKGLNLIICMPENLSDERKKILVALGAKLYLTDKDLGVEGAIKKAKELHEQIEGSIIISQFANLNNSGAHYKTTGPEIFRDTDGKVDIFVATCGTGGTITGTSRFLKEKNPNIKSILVEPASSPFLKEGIKGAHKIQGIGAGFKPDTLELSYVDEIITVSDEDAYKCARDFAKLEGMLIGISSGAALSAALEIAKRVENKHKNIVVILPDTGERYMSTDLYTL